MVMSCSSKEKIWRVEEIVFYIDGMSEISLFMA